MSVVKRDNKGWSEKLRRKLEEEYPDVMQNAMLRVESEAKRVVYLGRPDHLIRRSGNLGRSITTETHRGADGGFVTTTGTNSVYAPTHEFGDDRLMPNGSVAHIPARPFLHPSFQAKKGEVMDVCKKGLKRIFDEVKL